MKNTKMPDRLLRSFEALEWSVTDRRIFGGIFQEQGRNSEKHENPIVPSEQIGCGHHERSTRLQNAKGFRHKVIGVDQMF